MMCAQRTRARVALSLAFLLGSASGIWVGVGRAAAAPKLILTTWRVEPSTVKENQPWTVKLWVGNLGTEAPKKAFTVQVLGCDKEYTKCDKVYATHEVKPGSGDLVPGKLPGKEIEIVIKQGLPKGEHFIRFVIDSKKEVVEAPLQKDIRVPVGFWKY